jgi:hypothetical protein
MCLINLILWILTIGCVACGVMLKGSLTSILFFVAAFLLMPLPKLRHFLEKFIGETLRVILIIALVIVALGCAPQIQEYLTQLFAQIAP